MVCPAKSTVSPFPFRDARRNRHYCRTTSREKYCLPLPAFGKGAFTSRVLREDGFLPKSTHCQAAGFFWACANFTSFTTRKMAIST